MSTKEQSTKSHKLTTVASVIVLVAFLGVAGFTALSVTNIASIVESSILANTNGVPETWEKLSTLETTESSTDAVLVNNNYIEYTTYLKNSDSSDTLTLTHISSFVQEADNKGFVPLAEDTLEYTYDPTNNASWTPLKVSAPENSEDGFKLDTVLYLGQADSNTDTIYFRYNVSPADDGTISDKVSFVTENSAGEAGLTTSTAAFDYEKPSSDSSSSANPTDTSTNSTDVDASSSSTGSTETDPTSTTAAAHQSSDDTDGESSFAKPLGVSSKAPSTSVMNAASLGAISISQDSITTSVVIIIAALGVFAASLIAYLVIRGRSNKKPTRK